MKGLGLFALFVLIVLGAYAEDPAPAQLFSDLGFETTVATGLSTKETLAFGATSDMLDAVAQLSVNSDGKYGADIANFSNTKSFFNNYFFLDKGYLDFHLRPFEVQLGRYTQGDPYQSPYSLFLNSEGHSALGTRLKYEDRFFSYETRWISLNQNSDFGTANTPLAWQQVWNGTTYLPTGGTGFPDRGANLKTFVFKFGDVRVGLQDAAVYTGRAFDAEHFLSPIPSYFTQYVKDTAGRPWTTSGNENNLIGFFFTVTKPDYDWGGQVLIDDFSLHFLFPNQVPNNPWKAAWTLGGHLKTDWGRFGLFHAGALKYTFEPITTGAGQDSQSAYGYTYYPDVEYSVGGSSFRSLSIEDNALGYLHGENNAALKATYDNAFGQHLRWSTDVELLVAGANSPANPWQDVTTSDDTGGTHWLDGANLEWSLVWTSDLRWHQDDWDLYADWKLGGIANALGLRDVNGVSKTDTTVSALDRLVRIWAPTNQTELVAQVTLGVTWHIDVSALQRSLAGEP